MGIARTFDGVLSNFISGDPLFIATDKCTVAAWIRVSDLSVDRAITGRFLNADPGGFGFAIRTTGNLFFDTENNAGTFGGNDSSVAVLGALNNWRFVAVTYDLTAAQTKFYSGSAASNVAQLGTTQVPTVAIDPSTTASCDIGRWNAAADANKIPFKGEIDQIGVWRVVLTLAELQAFADCAGALPQTGEAIFIYRITGASPEPNASTLTATNGTINGTVPVFNGITGCDISAGGLSNVQPRIVKPPSMGGISGGPPILTSYGYDPGGSMGGDVGIQTADSFAAPDYGQDVEKLTQSGMNYGKRGGISRPYGVPAPRFFSLAHLSSYLGKRRG